MMESERASGFKKMSVLVLNHSIMLRSVSTSGLMKNPMGGQKGGELSRKIFLGIITS